MLKRGVDGVLRSDSFCEGAVWSRKEGILFSEEGGQGEEEREKALVV